VKIKNWIKRKFALLAFALSSAEKDTFGQKGDVLGNEGSMSQTLNQGMLSDSLLRGEITLPVKELRWRLYKVLSESKSRVSTIIGYDEDNLPIVSTSVIDKYNLKKVLRDNIDDYDVELVVNNEAIVKSTLDMVNGNDFDKESSETFDLVGSDKIEDSNTLGEISFDDIMSMFKDKKSIYVEREYKPKFEIEYFSKKLIVRKVNKETRLLEFYISSYTDPHQRRSRLLLSEIKKAIKNPRGSDLLDISKIGFISDKTIGVPDGLEYEYSITKFDKIIEFNGHYVIKFLATVTVDGHNIFNKYKLEELEERYKNKEAK